MPFSRFDHFERRLLSQTVGGVAVFAFLFTASYATAKSGVTVIEVIGFAVFMIVGSALFGGIVVFLPLSNTHKRLKKEYGDSYVRLLNEGLENSPLKGIGDAQVRLLKIERELRGGSPSASA